MHLWGDGYKPEFERGLTRGTPINNSDSTPDNLKGLVLILPTQFNVFRFLLFFGF